MKSFVPDEKIWKYMAGGDSYSDIIEEYSISIYNHYRNCGDNADLFLVRLHSQNGQGIFFPRDEDDMNNFWDSHDFYDAMKPRDEISFIIIGNWEISGILELLKNKSSNPKKDV